MTETVTTSVQVPQTHQERPQQNGQFQPGGQQSEGGHQSGH